MYILMLKQDFKCVTSLPFDVNIFIMVLLPLNIILMYVHECGKQRSTTKHQLLNSIIQLTARLHVLVWLPPLV